MIIKRAGLPLPLKLIEPCLSMKEDLRNVKVENTEAKGSKDTLKVLDEKEKEALGGLT